MNSEERQLAEDLQALGGLTILSILATVFDQPDKDTFTRQEILVTIDRLRSVTAPPHIQEAYQQAFGTREGTNQ